MNKIWIDAGHGGSASGAVNGSRMEKDDTLRIALELQKQFEAQGCLTVMTRLIDEFVSLEYRTKLERDNKCNLAVSVHRNSASASASGVEAWVHSSAISSIVSWAEKTVKSISEACGMSVRAGTAAKGVYKGYRDNPDLDFYVNYNTNSPSMLLEIGFISSDFDNTALDKNVSAICTAIVKEACAYLNIDYRATSAVIDYKAKYEALHAEIKEICDRYSGVK